MASPPPAPRPARRGAVAAWCLYDFANSTFSAVIPASVFAGYYTRDVVGNEAGRGDAWWGAAVAISAVLVAVSSPVMGAVADMSGARRLLFATYTAVAVGALALFPTIGPGDVLWGAVLFIVADAAYEGAVVFYNAYLPELVPRDRIGRVSGLGFAVGYVGSMVGLAVALPFAREERYGPIWLCIAAIFAAFALPAILVLGPGGKRTMSVGRAAAYGWTHVATLLREVLGMPTMRRFLIGYFLYINGVNAAIYFSAPIATRTFGLSMTSVVVLFFVVQLSALVGALAMARPTDVLGPKRVVQLSLLLWTTTAVLFITTESTRVFWAACVVAGLGLGTVQAASRAFMATLVPAEREDELFGFYALCGKTASPLGAAVFGVVSEATGSQRPAIAALSVFFLAGLVVIHFVPAGGPTVGRAA
jgi:UMF1 family MFS transporter